MSDSPWKLALIVRKFGRVERSAENVTVATLKAVANILEVHVSKLFSEVDPDTPWPDALPAGMKRKRV